MGVKSNLIFTVQLFLFKKCIVTVLNRGMFDLNQPGCRRLCKPAITVISVGEAGALINRELFLLYPQETIESNKTSP